MQQRADPVPWPEVLRFYAERAEAEPARFHPLLAVARHLARSRYANSLFAWPTEQALALGRAPVPGEQLRIGFDAAQGHYVFVHARRADDAQPWSRDCAPDEWQAVLERLFHKRLQWFHEG